MELNAEISGKRNIRIDHVEGTQFLLEEGAQGGEGLLAKDKMIALDLDEYLGELSFEVGVNHNGLGVCTKAHNARTFLLRRLQDGGAMAAVDDTDESGSPICLHEGLLEHAECREAPRPKFLNKDWLRDGSLLVRTERGAKSTRDESGDLVNRIVQV